MGSGLSPTHWAEGSLTASRRRTLTFAVLGLLMPVIVITGIAMGSVPLRFSDVWAFATGRAVDPTTEAILWTLRFPRVLIAVLVGGGLAVVGATFQSIFRNPMADAGILGVGSGAALGAVIAIKFGIGERVFLAIPLSAFVGAMIATGVVYALGHAWGRPGTYGLLLTGMSVSALGGACTSLLLVTTEEYRVKTVLFWLAGGLEGRSWTHLSLGACFVLVGSVALLLFSRTLDALSLGEEESRAIGVPVHWARFGLLSFASLVAGASTALAGSVPFVGLIAPHALRALVGPRARVLLPAAFLGGAILVTLADLAARTLSNRLDLPLGALTAIVGAPYFVLALRGAESRS